MSHRLISIALWCAVIWFSAAVLIAMMLIVNHRATHDDLVSAMLCAGMLLVCCGALGIRQGN